jgi:N-acetylmuramic acid 6-phosphate etherase
MVDLQPTNEKLRQRARRLVATIVGCSPEAAADLLRAAGGNTKVAIVAGLLELDSSAAVALLEAGGGSIRLALQEARGG